MKIRMKLMVESEYKWAEITLPDNLSPAELVKAGTLVGTDAHIQGDLWDEEVRAALNRLGVEWKVTGPTKKQPEVSATRKIRAEISEDTESPWSKPRTLTIHNHSIV